MRDRWGRVVVRFGRCTDRGLVLCLGRVHSHGRCSDRGRRSKRRAARFDLGEGGFLLCVCCNGRKSGRCRGGDVDLCGFHLEVNTEVVDHGFYVGLGGDAGDNVLRPDGVKREGLEFDDVAESREDGRSTGGLEVSDRGEDVVPKRRERLVFR